MEADKLEEVLAAHSLWCADELRGKRADLREADLRRANLQGANLRGADLRDANLRRANLQGANLQGADLRFANLRRANLRGANLVGADLRDADLRDADLRDADLQDADLRDANLKNANLEDATFPQNTPAVTRAQIKAAIDAGGGLDMALWHTCDTTHCIAGWAVHLAGEPGYELEAEMGTAAAAAFMLAAGGERVPDFHGTQEYGLAWLRGEV